MRNKILNCAPSNNNGTDWELPKVSVGALPDEFSRRDYTTKVTNQGSVGSCVGQATKVAFNDTAQCSNVDLSAMWIYKAAKRHDYWKGEDYSGTSISGACEALRKEGACLEELYPYKKTTENYEPNDDAKNDALKRKIKAYFKISVGRIEEIKEVVMNEPLILSIMVHSKFYEASSDGVVKKEGYIDSKKQGGHAMAITGWKVIDGELHWECQNSWGVRWGDSGFCYIPSSLLSKIANSSFYYLITDGEMSDDLIRKRQSEKMTNYGKLIHFIREAIRSFLGLFK